MGYPHRKIPHASKKTQNKLRLKALFSTITGFSLLLLFVWGVEMLRDPGLFPVRQIQIKGEYQYITQGELREVITPFIQDGFFYLDVEKLRQRLLQLPWMADVSIWRIWPDNVTIAIREQVPVAYWKDLQGERGLLNRAGILFKPHQLNLSWELPLLQGPKGRHDLVLQHYFEINSVLNSVDLKVVELGLTARGAWYAISNNHIRIELGRSGILDRLKRFVDIYPSLFGQSATGIKAVDLRYTNGLAVKNS